MDGIRTSFDAEAPNHSAASARDRESGRRGPRSPGTHRSSRTPARAARPRRAGRPPRPRRTASSSVPQRCSGTLPSRSAASALLRIADQVGRSRASRSASRRPAKPPALEAAAEDRVHAALEGLERLDGGGHVGGLGVVHVEHAVHRGDLLQAVRHAREGAQRLPRWRRRGTPMSRARQARRPARSRGCAPRAGGSRTTAAGACRAPTARRSPPRCAAAVARVDREVALGFWLAKILSLASR